MPAPCNFRAVPLPRSRSCTQAAAPKSVSRHLTRTCPRTRRCPQHSKAYSRAHLRPCPCPRPGPWRTERPRPSPPRTIFVCSCTARTVAKWPPARTVTSISSRNSDSAAETENAVCSMYPGSAAISSCVTCDTTCKPASASPASAPMAAAASMPRSPPVFGTMTLLTFLMSTALLAATSISDGSVPKAFLATAAQ